PPRRPRHPSSAACPARLLRPRSRCHSARHRTVPDVFWASPPASALQALSVRRSILRPTTAPSFVVRAPALRMHGHGPSLPPARLRGTNDEQIRRSTMRMTTAINTPSQETGPRVDPGPPRAADVSKLARLRERLHDPAWRRFGYALIAGKALGIALGFGVMVLGSSIFGSAVRAEDPTLAGNDIVNPINTVWTLVAAFLVFGMQAGFTMLEAGFSRSRETVNVLME